MNQLSSVKVRTADLQHMSERELLDLIERYPFYQNLYFRLVNYYLENGENEKANSWLPKTATYATDRSFLYQIVYQQQSIESLENSAPGSEQLEEDPLELLDIQTTENIQSEPNKPTLQKTMFMERDIVEPPSKNILNDLLEGSDYFDEDEPSSFSEFISPEKLIPDEKEEGLSMLEKIVETSPVEPYSAGKAQLSFWSSFHQILKTKNTILLEAKLSAAKFSKSSKESNAVELEIKPSKHESKTIGSTEKPFKLKKPFSSKPNQGTPSEERPKKVSKEEGLELVKLVEESAEKSIMESKEIASETLAELLVVQEQYEKALNMYKRLILIFPEKSSFFAAKIKELNKKLSQ